MGLFRRKTSYVQLPDANQETPARGTARHQASIPEVGSYWLELHSEPGNPVDSNAVAVWATKRVGYIPAERTAVFGPFIRRMEHERMCAMVYGDVRQFPDGGRWILLRLPSDATVIRLMAS